MNRAAGPRVAFVNGGILGLASFAEFVRRELVPDARLRATSIVLTEQLTSSERALRRLMCLPLAPRHGALANADLLRFRAELHAGVQARRRLARRGPFDVLHFHRQATAYASLGLMRRVPAIVSIDCTQSCALDEAASRVERRTIALNAARDGAVFRHAAAIISTSRWAADDLQRRYPDCRTAVHVMPPPVLSDGFDESWIAGRQARAAAGARPRVLFVGADFERKGGRDLLDAWQMGGCASRADLVLVTDWPIADPLPQGVRVCRGVRAFTREWYERWREADLFVMPTRHEAFGLVFQEAAAAGLPAIGTFHNAVPEIVADGETGLLVPVRRIDRLASAMNRLIDDGGLRVRMGAAARAKIRRDADPVRYREQLIALIEQLCHARRAREGSS
ncbi:MAG TPA: glycosyltransferase family 4 protein [Vicinamibacterales bacterium]|nr:glycosyltransferase family 4 protein [Vicinamibacterales bacterium]